MKKVLIPWQVFVEKSSYLLTGICTGFRISVTNLVYFSIDKGKDWIYISRFFIKPSNSREPVVLAFFFACTGVSDNFKKTMKGGDSNDL